MKKKGKKLQLHRETLGALTEGTLAAAAGGTGIYTCNECNTTTRIRTACGSCDTCYCTLVFC